MASLSMKPKVSGWAISPGLLWNPLPWICFHVHLLSGKRFQQQLFDMHLLVGDGPAPGQAESGHHVPWVFL